MDIIINEIEGFEWDRWNIYKIRHNHGVELYECEEIFFNENLFVLPDEKHSLYEQRYYSLGITESGRLLFVVFTIRSPKIRVISARPMSKKERKSYYEKIKKDTGI